MIDVLAAEDVHRLDADAAASGVPVERLMENAGYAVALEARRMLGGTYGRRVVVVCGKGNNAGDGLVAGRILRRWGAHVTAVLLFGERAFGGPAAQNLARFDGRVAPVGALDHELARADLTIDAIFGVGLRRAPEGNAAAAISAMGSVRPVLSVDVPSGVEADTGAVFGDAVTADRTVTFAGLKPGLLFMPGRARAGDVVVSSIGMRPHASVTAGAFEPSDVRRALPTRGEGSHKRNTGTLLVIAGSRAMPGAAVLVALAAVRAGAGLTVVCAPEEVCGVVVTRVPEVTTIPAPSTSDGTIDPKALDVVAPRLGEFDAVAIGPGLTRHPAGTELVRSLLEAADAPVVLDADGLNATVERRDVLTARRAPTVLTPHAGELARLVGRTTAELEADRLRAAGEAARDLSSVVVYKGPGSVVAEPGGARFVNTTGGPALAQGGTGDVLTGLLGALIAMAASESRRGAGAPPEATTNAALARLVAAGTWVHGRAGDRIAARLGRQAATAGALVEEIPPTVSEVLAS